MFALRRAFATAAAVPSAAQTALAARLSLPLPPAALAAALTHSSVRTLPAGPDGAAGARGGGAAMETNERLAFFGDAVLQFLVAEFLTVRHPNLPPKALHHALTHYVSNEALTKRAQSLGLADAVQWQPTRDGATAFAEDGDDVSVEALLGEGETTRGEAKVLATSMEALIGAIYKELGPRAAREFVHSHVMGDEVDVAASLVMAYPKLSLGQHCKQMDMGRPEYKILRESGVGTHLPVYVAGVFCDGVLLKEGIGRSRKKAENKAALEYLLEHYAKPSDAPFWAAEELVNDAQ